MQNYSTLSMDSYTSDLEEPGELKPRSSEPGEVVVHKAYSRLREPEGDFLGSLFVTNFRVIFEHQIPPNSNRRLLTQNLSIPLCSIFRLEKGAVKRGKALIVRCKDFRDLQVTSSSGLTPQLVFSASSDQINKVADTITQLAFPAGSRRSTQFFAFANRITFSDAPNGWHVYNQFKEFARLGLPDQAWRFTDVNRNYDAIKTYPSMFVVPRHIDDEMLREDMTFRSKGRIPALVWRHPLTFATITRCAQPQTGAMRRRSSADETLCRAIRLANPNPTHREKDFLILDARPRLNATTNQFTKGAGSEIMANYPNTQIEYLGIHHIHAVRSSMFKLRDVVFTEPGLEKDDFYTALDESKWLHHIATILRAATFLANMKADVGVQITGLSQGKKPTSTPKRKTRQLRKLTVLQIESGVSVMVHCSDGWDRTSQLTSLGSLLLDPYYRTLEGFIVLLEKDWLSFGHHFHQRCGHGFEFTGSWILMATDEQHSDYSPVFLQFIDCVWQIMRQFPSAFEFNETFLLKLMDELYACRYGTFLFDHEFKRKELLLEMKTPSLWSEILADRTPYLNPYFLIAPYPEDTLKINTQLKFLRLWDAYYLRWLLKDANDTQNYQNQFIQIIADPEAYKVPPSSLSNSFFPDPGGPRGPDSVLSSSSPQSSPPQPLFGSLQDSLSSPLARGRGVSLSASVPVSQAMAALLTELEDLKERLQERDQLVEEQRAEIERLRKNQLVLGRATIIPDYTAADRQPSDERAPEPLFRCVGCGVTMNTPILVQNRPHCNQCAEELDLAGRGLVCDRCETASTDLAEVGNKVLLLLLNRQAYCPKCLDSIRRKLDDLL